MADAAPAAADATASAEAVLHDRPSDAAFKFDLSHQEMSRIMRELEVVFASQPCEWLPVEAMANMLSQELGYEDLNEFEDALQGEFADFIRSLPHAELSTNDRGTQVFRLIPEPADLPPRQMTLQITDRKHLWHVFMQAPDARVVIPEIEFEFQPMGERRIDTVYNHIASAIFNLGMYVQGAMRSKSLSEDQEGKILDTIHLLNKMLDVEQPFTWLVVDPTSRSSWQPWDGVTVEPAHGAQAA